MSSQSLQEDWRIIMRITKFSSVSALSMAAVLALFAGCYPAGTVATPTTGPSSLTLRVDWANACTTCTSVTIPKNCWSGNLTTASDTAGGQTSFSLKCNESMVAFGNPTPIQSTTSVMNLKAGTWSVRVDTQDGRSVICPATVKPSGYGLTWVETNNACGML
jgi:hypothetical protein